MANDIIEITAADTVVVTEDSPQVIEVTQDGIVIEVNDPIGIDVIPEVTTVEIYGQSSNGVGVLPGGDINSSNPFLDQTPPSQAHNLILAGRLSSVEMSWLSPTYVNHDVTEIWRNTVDDRGTATQVADVKGSIHTDHTDFGVTYYYWIRYRSLAGVVGEWNTLAGTQVTTGVNPTNMLNTFQDKINETHLVQSLVTEIGRIDTTANGLITETINRAKEIAASAEALTAQINVAIGNEVLARDGAIVQAINDEGQNTLALIASEQLIRVSAEGAIASDLQVLEAKLDSNYLAEFDPNTNYAIGDLFQYGGNWFQVLVTQTQPNVPVPNPTYYEDNGPYTGPGTTIEATATVVKSLIARVTATEAFSEDATLLNTSLTISADGTLFNNGVAQGQVSITDLGGVSATAIANTYLTQESFGITLTDLQSQIDGSFTSWFLTGIPTLANEPALNWTTTELKDLHVGDLYYDKTPGFAYIFVEALGVYSWERIQDADVIKALQDASNAQDTADSKRRVFVTTPTPPYDIGDLWDTGTGLLKRSTVNRPSGSYEPTDWVDVVTPAGLNVDLTASSTAFQTLKSTVFVDPETAAVTAWSQDTTLLNSSITIGADGTLNGAGGGQVTAAGIGAVAASTYISDIAAIQAQIDQSITTWFLSGTPTLANAPANTWTDDATKDVHLDDLYFDIAGKLSYRFTKSGVVYSWVKVEDADTIAALTAAANAQDTADGKRRVFVATPTPPYDIGDLWDTGSGLYRSSVDRAEGASYVANDWVQVSDITAASAFVTSTYPADKQTLEAAISDGKLDTWYTGTDPSLTWEGTNASHTGDLWFNTSTKKLKRWSGTAWSADIEDQKALDAFTNAAAAQDTADGKRRVFVVQPTPPYDVGDLWDTGAGNIKRAQTDKAQGQAYAAGDWVTVVSANGIGVEPGADVTATASAFTALESKVYYDENKVLTAWSQDQTLLNNRITINTDGSLNNAGSGSVTPEGIGVESYLTGTSVAFTGLASTVTTQGQSITSLSTSLTQLETSAGTGANWIGDSLFAATAAGTVTKWVPHGQIVFNPSAGLLSTSAAVITANSTLIDLNYDKYFPAVDGDTLHFRIRVKVSAAFNGTLQLGVKTYSADEVLLADRPSINIDSASYTPRDTWTWITGTITVTNVLTSLVSMRISVLSDASAGTVTLTDVYFSSQLPDGSYAIVQQYGQSIDGLEAQYTVKTQVSIDGNTYVAGYGIATEPTQGGAISTFSVLADQFAIIQENPGDPQNPFTVFGTDVNGDAYFAGNVSIKGDNLWSSVSIQVGENTPGNNYIIITDGDVQSWKYIGGAHRKYANLTRVETGVAASGATVAIPGYFETTPKVLVTPNSLPTYNAAYAGQSQQWSCRADNIQEVTPGGGQYQFDAIVDLQLAANTGTTLINADSGVISSNTYTSAEYATENNTSTITPKVTVGSQRGTGLSPNYYYRKVQWRVGYSLTPGGPYTYPPSGYRTITIGADLNNNHQDSVLITLPSAAKWYVVAEFIASDDTGTFSTGGDSYLYAQETVTNTPESTWDYRYYLGGPSWPGDTIHTHTLPAATVPIGYSIYKVDYSFKYQYSIEMSYTDSANLQLFDIDPAGKWYLSDIASVPAFGGNDLETNLNYPTSYVSVSFTHNSSTYYTDEFKFKLTSNRTYGQDYTLRAKDASATIYYRKAIVNSTTPSNFFEFTDFNYALSASQVIGTGQMNWMAIGQ